ncbi:hypothetical protein V8E36_006138 [Tilletia maclaganii]
MATGIDPAQDLLQRYQSIIPASILRNLTGIASSSPAGPAPNATLGLLDLDEHIAGHFFIWLGDGFFRHLFAGAAVLGVYFVLGATVLARRISLRQCELFKVVHRAHGRYIVPNVFDTFTLNVLLFCLMDICYVIVAFRAYHMRDLNAQHCIRLFEIMQWIPMYAAGWFASVGSFYTAPGALDGPPQLRSRPNPSNRTSITGGSRKEMLQRLSARLRLPFFLNMAILGMPLVIMATIIPFAVVTQKTHAEGLTLYLRFHAELIQPLLAAQTPPLSLNSTLAGTILDQAMTVRESAIHDAELLSSAFYVWTGAASMVLAFYMPAGGVLLLLIRKQVRRQRDIVRSGIGTYKQQGGTMRKDVTEIPARLHRWCINCGAKLRASHLGPCECGFVVGRTVNLVQSRSGDDVEAVDGQRDEAAAELAADHAILARMAAAFKGRVVKQQGTPLLRYFYLRRCLLNLTLLYLSIVATAWSVLIAGGIYGAHVLPAMELGPTGMSRLYLITALLSNWAVLVFGSLSTAAIWMRHFDPANDPSYYARAGETGWAPSTLLVVLGIRQLPKPFRRWFHSQEQDQPKGEGEDDEMKDEDLPSTTHIMRPAGGGAAIKVATMPRSFSQTQSHGSVHRAARSVRRFSAALVTPHKFKHVMQEPPTEGEGDSDAGDHYRRRRDAPMEMAARYASPHHTFGDCDVDAPPTDAASTMANQSSQPALAQTTVSSVSWGGLRRSASALSMGTAADRPGSPTIPSAASSRPPTSGTGTGTTGLFGQSSSNHASGSASASTPGIGLSRTPVRFATPFGPIECPAPDEEDGGVAGGMGAGLGIGMGAEPRGKLSDAPSLTHMSMHNSRSGSLRSSAHHGSTTAAAAESGGGIRQGLGLMLSSSMAIAGSAAAAMVRPSSSASTPNHVTATAAAAAAAVSSSASAGWNDRFTALRRSTQYSSHGAGPGDSSSASTAAAQGPTPHLTSISSASSPSHQYFHTPQHPSPSSSSASPRDLLQPSSPHTTTTPAPAPAQQPQSPQLQPDQGQAQVQQQQQQQQHSSESPSLQSQQSLQQQQPTSSSSSSSQQQQAPHTWRANHWRSTSRSSAQ